MRPCVFVRLPMPVDDPIRVRRHRVRVFVDFWNYTLSMRDVDEAFRTDWSQLGPVLARADAAIVDADATGECQRPNFYGSPDPARAADRKLHRWATTVVDTFPGVSVSIVPCQKKRSPPVCPACHAAVRTCPACGVHERHRREGCRRAHGHRHDQPGLADNYDVAALVSFDRDFVPVAEFLETRGIRVIHGAFPPRGAQLTARCWGSIDVPRPREEFRFTRPRPNA